LYAQDISAVKHKLLYEGKVAEARKELLSLYNSAKEPDKKEILSLLGEYTNTSYSTLFKMCRYSNMDCTYYKGKSLEAQGNAGSAMELYLEAGYTDDYMRLKAYSGQELPESAKTYYHALLYMEKGEWDKAINILSEKTFNADPKARFYLGYTFLMKGENEKAKNLLKRQPDNLNFFEKLEYKRLEALILYAENKQLEAMDIFKDILKYMPQDFLSKRYTAHIYYRTGWFDKAEKIYSELINNEWRDTELYYLLSERCEMRIRNLKFDLAKKDAEKLIKEYPQRKDFIANLVALFITYADIDDARYFTARLSDKGGPYEQGLRYFSEGLVLEFKQDPAGALSMFKNAMDVFPAPEYEMKVTQAEQNLKESDSEKAPKPFCRDYDIKKLGRDIEVTVKNTAFERPAKYYITAEADGTYKVTLPLMFAYDKERVHFGDKEKLWKDKAQKIWSVNGMKLDISNGDLNKVDLVPWPSSFYLKRASSHEWSILTPPSVIAHEVGHLLGLDDEYYETDPRLSSRNEGRFIGPVDSIMRNMLNGMPEKRHIHFILSPLKCQ
jgi:tetratricopeptide (TPR) repeat protein